MVELDLEEIKKKTSKGLTQYYNFNNIYRWFEAIDTTENKEYKEVPLYEIVNYDTFGKTPVPQGLQLFGTGNDFRDWGCFGRFTYYYTRHKRTGRIIFEIKVKSKMSDRLNNHSWMTIEQMTYWIQTLQQESGLDFFFKVIQNDSDNSYRILFDFKKCTRLQMKYVLFWTRYIYEYPTSFCALDAMLLKRDFYPEETLQNLVTLVLDCQRLNSFHASTSQNLTINGNFITPEELHRKLTSPKTRFVSSLFGSCGFYDSRTIYGIELVSFFNERTITAEKWLSKVNRFDLYHRVYPALKEHELKLKKIEEKED